MLTAFSDIVALFNKSALCAQWENVTYQKDIQEST